MAFKLTHHDKDFFHAEGAKGGFRISKKGLTKKQHEKYASMCNGGVVKGGPKVQKLAEGGEVAENPNVKKLRDEISADLLNAAQTAGHMGYAMIGGNGPLGPAIDAGIAGVRSVVKGTPYDDERARIRQANQPEIDRRAGTVVERFPMPGQSPRDFARQALDPNGINNRLATEAGIEHAMMFAGAGPTKVNGPRMNLRPQTAAEGAAAAVRARGGTAADNAARFSDAAAAATQRFDATAGATAARFPGNESAVADALLRAREKAAAAGVYGKAGLAGAQAAADKPANKQTVAKIPWQDMTQEEALAFARAGEHLKQDKSGQFIGFPRGVTTMEQVNAIQQEALRRIRDVGGLGAGWYEKDGNFIRTVAPENPLEMTRGIATYSPQADPGPNLLWAASNKNQLLVDPAEKSLTRRNMPKTMDQAKKFLTVTRDLEAPMGKGTTGKKISQFAQDLAGGKDTGRPTLDLHAGRAHGFGDTFDRGFTDAEYGAQSGQQNMRLAHLQASDIPGPGPGGTWETVKQAQAADWIGSRARGYIRDRFGGAPMSSLTPAQKQEVVSYAMRGFSDAAPNATMHTVVEAIPSSAAREHLVGAKDASPEARAAFTDQFLGPAGTRHPVYEDLGAWNYPSRSGLGTFTDAKGATEMNPSRTYDLLGSYEKGSSGPSTKVHGATDRLSNFVGNYEAATGVQAGVPSHMVKSSGTTKGNAVELTFPEPLSPQATKELYAAVESTKVPLKKNGKPVVDEKTGEPVYKHAASLTDTGGGRFTLTGDWGGVDKRGFTALMKNASPELRAALEKAQQTSGGYTVGSKRGPEKKAGYVDYEKEWGRSPVDPTLTDTSAPVTKKFVRALEGEPTIMENLGSNKAIKADALRKFMANDQAPATLGSGPARANVQQLLSIISKDGLPGLLAHVKKYGYAGLPAVLPFLIPQEGEEKPKGFYQGGVVGEEDDFYVTLANDGSIMRVSKQALSPGLRGEFEGRVQRFDDGGQVLPLGPDGLPMGLDPNLDPALAGVAPATPPPPPVDPAGVPTPGFHYQTPGERYERDVQVGMIPPPTAEAPGGAPSQAATFSPYDPETGVIRDEFRGASGAAPVGLGGLKQSLHEVYASPTTLALEQQQRATNSQGVLRPGAAPAPAAAPLVEGPPTGPSAPTYAPPQVPAVPNYNGSGLSAEINDASRQIAAAQTEKGAVEAKGLSDLAEIEQRKVNQINVFKQQQQALLDKRNQIDEAMFNEIKNAKVDPKHFWEGKDTFQKVLAGVGMLLSGAGSGLTGQPNMAMDVINRAIDRDIDAQKANIALKRNLLSYNLQKTDSMLSALNLTKATMLEASAAMIETRTLQMKGDLSGPQHRLDAQMQRQQAAALRGQVSLQEIEAAAKQYELRMQQYKLQILQTMTQQNPALHPANGGDNTQFLRNAARVGVVNEANIAHEMVEVPAVGPDGRPIPGAPRAGTQVVWRLYGSEKARNDADNVFQATAVILPSIRGARQIIEQNPTGVNYLQNPQAAQALKAHIANIKISYERAIGGLQNQPSAGALEEIGEALGNPGGVSDAIFGRSAEALRIIEEQVHDRLKATRMGAHY